MPYDLTGRLVVGIASSALFDLTASDAVFREKGREAYRRFQEEHIEATLGAGTAFPFINRLLSLNDLTPSDDPLVEVIVLSRNSPETGLRVMRSIRDHHLPITRAIFMEGRSPYAFMEALNMSLFLSGNGQDVREAVGRGLPAGQVLKPPASGGDDLMDGVDQDLRIAFDFDGVLADDATERHYRASGLASSQAHESVNAGEALGAGPLCRFLANINRIQQCERQRYQADPMYRRRLRVSIVTARNAPAHERAIHSLKTWGVSVNDAFFLGGIDKSVIMSVLKAHIFFDDQIGHLEGTARFVPSVHIPFGIANEADSMTSR